MWQPAAGWQARLAGLLVAHTPALDALCDAVWGPVLYGWLTDPEMARAIDLHEFGGRRWINRELLERALGLFWLSLITSAPSWKVLPEDVLGERLVAAGENMLIMRDAAMDTGYDFDWMLDALK